MNLSKTYLFLHLVNLFCAKAPLYLNTAKYSGGTVPEFFNRFMHSDEKSTNMT